MTRCRSRPQLSRLMTKLSDTNILEQSQESFICQATEVGFISDNTVSIDAKHVEAQDQAPPEKATQSKPALKKHQRKSKDECDQWLNAAAEKAANLPLYEKNHRCPTRCHFGRLTRRYTTRSEMGHQEKSESKNVFWYDYKAHLVVGADSLYILQPLFSGGQLNDERQRFHCSKAYTNSL